MKTIYHLKSNAPRGEKYYLYCHKAVDKNQEKILY